MTLLSNYVPLKALPVMMRNPRHFGPVVASGLLVVLYLLYLVSNRSIPAALGENGHAAPSHPLITGVVSTSYHDFSTSPTLLVTAFFPLPSSKHTHEEYAAWMRLFLAQVTTPIVMYTSKSFAPTVKQLRGSLPIKINTQFETPFGVPPLQGLEETYAKQHDVLDPEKARHNPALYATWNAKAWLLQHAAENYASNRTEWFFWSDAGALRETHTFANWPDAERVKDAFAKASTESDTLLGDMFFIPIWDAPASSKKTRTWKESDGPLDLYKMSEGSFFGGRLDAVKWWASTFYALHDKYLSENQFVGKDQNLFNSIMFLHPQRFFTVWPRDSLHRRDSKPSDTPDRFCTWDPWYYYFYWLASDTEREAQRRLMKAEYADLPLWQRMLAWCGIFVSKAGRGECGMAKGWSFRDILWENIGRH